MKLRFKIVSIFVICLIIFSPACKNGRNEECQIIKLDGWNGKVENGVLEKIKIPFLSNISEMSLYNGALLLQQEKLDTSFAVWNVMEPLMEYVKFGQIGKGPSDILSNSLLLHNPKADSIRVLDGLNIKTYKMENWRAAILQK